MVFKNIGGLTGRLTLVIAAAAFGTSFHHVYYTGVVSFSHKLTSALISETDFRRNGVPIEESRLTMILAWTVSIMGIGSFIGALMSGYIADKLGRKSGLMWNNITIVVGVLLEFLSKPCWSYEMLIIGRFFIGLNTGLSTGLVPMYLVEISPIHLRGAVGTMHQLVFTISILVSHILGFLGTETLWPWILAASVILVIFQMCTLPLCPESPKYIMMKQEKEVEAQEALIWLRGTTDVQDEMNEMRTEYEAMLSSKVTLKKMFTSSSLRTPLTIACMMMLAQPLCGISAVNFYSTRIFESAGFDEATAKLATLGKVTIVLIVTCVSLVLVEKVGRKNLLLIGFGGMCFDVSLLVICLILKELANWISYFSIILDIVFVAMFAIGLGSIPWFLVSELFNTEARPIATSIALGVNWTANFIFGLSFFPLLSLIGPYIFIIFFVLLLYFTAFTYFKLPETKNKTSEEIAAYFKQQNY